ncbi:MAG: DNA damage-inducible protein D [Planctomycetes bacterium HGW-Planctomycetes-1]|nr:MAG: DNA damage-inducible protein D [Planctomycetes bacterium HGW-Planctomycetes-1]
MANEINKTPTGKDSPFEQIKRTNETGNEFWSSRDFAQILGYSDYRNFEQVIKKAKTACFNSGQRIEDHFVDITEMIEIGKGGQRSVSSVYMSRYACYLIVQNADPGKEIVALGQTYFAIQTRRQEVSGQEIEDKRRLLRQEIKTHNVRLAGAAKEAGVIKASDYAIFQNHGYKGLYGGLTAQDIHNRKRLKKGQQILDHMGSTELAANLFRATQTEEKLRRENIKGKEKANRTHREVGAKIRQTIKELGGTMPENLPAAEDIKKLETKQKKALKSKNNRPDDN